MDISLFQNDALSELSKITGLNQIQLNTVIEKSLTEEGIFNSEASDCGILISDLLTDSGYDLNTFYKVTFSIEADDSEGVYFFGALYFVGNSDCPACGCDINIEIEGLGNKEWENKSCTNCPWSDSEEPDFEELPKGYEYQ